MAGYDPWEGVQRGYEFGNALRQDYGNQVAGNALAAGNYGAATNALYGMGDLKGGMALQARQASAAAGQALAGGDYKGAASAVFGAGDIGSGLKIQEAQAEHEKEGAQLVGSFAQRLSDIRAKGLDVGAAFDIFAPQLARYETAEDLAAMRAQILAKPDETLMALSAGAAKAAGYEVRQAGEDVVIVDPRTGAEVNRIRGRRSVIVPDGASLYELGGDDAAPGAPQGFNPAVSPAANGETAAAQQPRSQRNNNPGNIEDGPFAQSLPGYAGTDGRFARFNDAAAGTQAQQRLLQSYGARGFDTVSEIINRWAPPSDNNPTPAYAAFVARKLGVDPNAQLDMTNPQVLAALSGAIAEFEGGPSSASNGGPRQAAQQPAQGAGGPRLLVSRPKAEKPTARPATAAEKAAFGIPQDVPAKMSPTGDIQVISGVGARAKAVPAAVGKGYTENNSAVRQIDEAIAQLRAYPGALGMANIFGDEIRQRTDQKGIPARAAVANIGSLIIHDRSGAAVTAAETPRLKPFIPMPTDTAAAAIAKLEAMKRQYRNANVEIETSYGEDSGYAPLGGQGRPQAQAAQQTGRPAPPRVGEVRKGYRYKGGNPADRNSWVKQ